MAAFFKIGNTDQTSILFDMLVSSDTECAGRRSVYMRMTAMHNDVGDHC
jgi:hypothetical protein